MIVTGLLLTRFCTEPYTLFTFKLLFDIVDLCAVCFRLDSRDSDFVRLSGRRGNLDRRASVAILEVDSRDLDIAVGSTRRGIFERPASRVVFCVAISELWCISDGEELVVVVKARAGVCNNAGRLSRSGRRGIFDGRTFVANFMV